MNEFHFLRPHYLWLAAPFILLLIFFMRCSRQGNIWQQVCSQDLIPYVLEKKSGRNTTVCLLSLATLALLIIALAGPTWQQITYPLIKPQSGLVIVLDLSDSMNAQDIKPSRLQRALYKVSDLLKQRHEGQTALIVFSGAPFIVTPLTDDVATIQSLLPVLDTKIMPATGQKVSTAIAKAGALLTQAGIQDGSVLLVTAELSNEDLDKSISLATEHGIKISVLGVGTETAAPIPKQEGGFMKDTSGALVMTTLSKKNLSQLAHATQGTYTTISLDDHDINQIIAAVSEINAKTSSEQTEMITSRWLDEGYLFVLLALPLAALFFRRGVLVILILSCPQMLPAFTADDLWQTPDQRAEQLFHQKEYEQAKELFENQEWQAAATYHTQDYKTAAGFYESDPSVEGRYNCGTSKAKHGDFKGALETYEQALELQPDHADTLYNKKIIEDFLKQQEENQSEQDSDKKSDQKKDKNKDKSEKDKSKQNQESERKDSDEDSESDQDADQDESNDDQKPSSEQDEDSKPDQESKDSQDNQPEEQSDDENKWNENSSSEVDEKQKEDLRQQFQDKMKNESEEVPKPEPQSAQAASAEDEEEAQHQIDERWLECIQDDPGGLLRRKFLQQYRKQGNR
jgi:Ca-activated chloride channel family protein